MRGAEKNLNGELAHRRHAANVHEIRCMGISAVPAYDETRSNPAIRKLNFLNFPSSGSSVILYGYRHRFGTWPFDWGVRGPLSCSRQLSKRRARSRPTHFREMAPGLQGQQKSGRLRKAVKYRFRYRQTTPSTPIASAANFLRGARAIARCACAAARAPRREVGPFINEYLDTITEFLRRPFAASKSEAATWRQGC
jgi:hypothetical protein